MQVMLKLKDYNGAHIVIDAKVVEDYKLVFEFLTCVLRRVESAYL